MATARIQLRFRHQITMLLVSILMFVIIAALLLLVPAYLSGTQRIAYDRLHSVSNIKTLWLLREFDEIERGLASHTGNLSLVDEIGFVSRLVPSPGQMPDLLGRIRQGDVGVDPLAGDNLSLYWQSFDRIDANFNYVESSFPGSQVYLVRPKDGMVLYTLHQAEERMRALPDYFVEDSSIRRCFERARDAERSYVFEDFYRYENRQPMACGATQITDGGKPIAILIHAFSTELINSLMALRPGLGESGETYLVGADNLMRTESRFLGKESAFSPQVDNQGVADALRGLAGAGVINDYRGQEVFAVWQPITLDAISWSFITQIDSEEVYRSIRESIVNLLLGLLVSLAALLLIAYLYAVRTERPLLKLLNTARRVASGEYVQVATRHYGTREIHELVENFNLMAEQIRERTEALDAAREKAEEATLEAEKANHAKSDFLSRMSHELRTPLNGVLGYSQILKKDANIDANQRETLLAIENCGHHLLRLINHVLDLSKIESGALDADYQACSVAQLIQQVVDVVRPKAIEKGLSFVVSANDIPSIIMTDDVKLRQVLINLLGNAINFTSRGTVELTAELVARDKLRFAVRDTGVGIAANDLEYIFDPFRQTASGKRAGGTGLGLPITRQLCELLESQLIVNSELGVGTCFEFIIPFVHADIEGAVEQSSNLFIPYLSGGEDISILVADDNDTNRDILVQVLNGAGFQTLEAADGQQVLDTVDAASVDLILMDIKMPVMGGIEATEMLRATYSSEDLPIIAVSATVQPEVLSAASNAGCNEFLAKPVDLGRLFTLIEQLLDVFVENLGEQGERAKTSAAISQDIRPAVVERLEQFKAAASAGDIGECKQLLGLLQELLPKHELTTRIERWIGAFDLQGLGDYCSQMLVDLNE